MSNNTFRVWLVIIFPTKSLWAHEPCYKGEKESKLYLARGKKSAGATTSRREVRGEKKNTNSKSDPSEMGGKTRRDALPGFRGATGLSPS